MLRASHLQLRLQRKAVLLQNGACQLLALGGKDGRLDATGLGLGAGRGIGDRKRRARLTPRPE